MNATSHTEPMVLDVIVSNLQDYSERAYEALAQLSQGLDQTLGSEVTTALTVILGLISLALALLPVYSSWRKPAPIASAQLSEPAARQNDLTEEVVKMHPECLKELYGLSSVQPVEPPPVVQPVPAEPIADLAAITANANESKPDSRNDMLLGLIADISEESAKQQQVVEKLTLLTAHQEKKIDMLVAQLKAQSSAFLLQGERLLRLESLVEQVPVESKVDEAASEETQRLSTFDQAIERAAQGATAETLMEECGLSVSEARLVVLVHGKAYAG